MEEEDLIRFAAFFEKNGPSLLPQLTGKEEPAVLLFYL